MKNIILLTLFAFVSITSNAQTETYDTIKVGSVLTYSVNADGKKYDFIITIKKLSNSITEGASFDWKMTAPINKSGTINISAGAMDSSFAWYNYFSSGTINLENQTSVMLSYWLIEDILYAYEGEPLMTDLQVNGVDSDYETFYLKKISEEYNYTKNGNTLTSMKVDRIANEDGSKWVLINTKDYHAYIVEMNVGFHIKLKSVKY